MVAEEHHQERRQSTEAQNESMMLKSMKQKAAAKQKDAKKKAIDKAIKEVNKEMKACKEVKDGKVKKLLLKVEALIAKLSA